MPFYALRVVCQSCGTAFIVGGNAKSDLTQWRRLSVECSRCSAETPAADGETVNLSAAHFRADAEALAGSQSNAWAAPLR